jgi:rhamnogalacturonan endolyase
VDPRYEGFESWVAGAGITGMFDVKGNKISEKNPSVNFGIFWDDDLLSELLNSTTISKWDYLAEKSNLLLDAAQYDCVSNNGTKSTPALSADLFGDWREEVMFRTRDGKELRIFTTTIQAKNRLFTFMHDPQYRQSIAWQNVAYNQPPHTSFYVGPNMKAPKRPDIKVTKRHEPVKTPRK